MLSFRLATAARKLCLGAIALAAFAGLAHAGPFAFVTNKDSNNVSVIDLATNAVVATVPVGVAPMGVAINPAGTRAYVANWSSTSLSVINTATNTVIATVNFDIYAQPVGVAVNPAGTFVYVVTNAYYGNQVHVIDTLTNSVAAPAFSVALSSPWGITFRPDGARGFVAGIGSNRLGIIDPGANSYLGETYTGAAPFEAVVSPDGARVYVTNVNGHSVSVINAVTYANIVDVPVGTNPYGIAINAAGTLVYAVNRTSETVSVIDTASNTVVGTVNLPVGSSPLGIDLNLAGTLAYVANSGNGTVSVIDTVSNTVVDTVSVGANPHAIGRFIAYLSPEAPTIDSATAGDGQATIAFTAPLSDGGSPITAYTATCNPGAFSTGGPASPLILTGLSNGTAYTCSVTATTAVGTSVPSANVSVTPATVPDAPTIGTATAGEGQISVEFTVPAFNGGAAITSYTATCGAHSASGPVTPVVVSGLTNGSNYTCTVKATNSMGIGAPSLASIGVTPVASPPNIGKLFGTSPITVGQTSLLTITVTNPNVLTTLTGIAFSDALPAGVTAANAAAAPACGGTLTVNANVISLAGGVLAAGANCAIPVTVTGAVGQAAAWVNTINSVTSVEGGTNSTPATANIAVNANTTTAILSANPHPSVVGAAVTVTASVGALPSGLLARVRTRLKAVAGAPVAAPTGSILITDGLTGCTIVLPAASCAWTSAATGTRMLVATYGGSAGYAGSVSPARAHVVVSVDQQSPVTVTKAGTGTGIVAGNDAVIACGPTCAHTYAHGTLLTLSATPDAGSVFVGWLGACIGSGSCVLNVGSALDVSATFAPDSVLLHIDIDGNAQYDALTDGLLLVRYLYGMTGTPLTINAIGDSPTRETSGEVMLQMDNIRPLLDVDGNGHVDAGTDGMLLIRY
ncbi:MAG: hypothetical protein KAX84_08380, partial [Burkholderiales bacterium]|nr:hypothetical protein [Burkholderiales bacterium]